MSDDNTCFFGKAQLEKPSDVPCDRLAKTACVRDSECSPSVTSAFTFGLTVAIRLFVSRWLTEYSTCAVAVE